VGEKAKSGDGDEPAAARAGEGRSAVAAASAASEANAAAKEAPETAPSTLPVDDGGAEAEDALPVAPALAPGAKRSRLSGGVPCRRALRRRRCARLPLGAAPRHTRREDACSARQRVSSGARKPNAENAKTKQRTTLLRDVAPLSDTHDRLSSSLDSASWSDA
jgi:hypothetical protein